MFKKINSKIMLTIVFGAFPLILEAQVRDSYDQGSNALLRQLQRLQTTASILHTGAHPDDEDSALVAYHARGLNARTAYLSLTRGSGGQNIIGPEQSDALGVIRTEELLQARRLDGAEQLFTRANDFGFSKYRIEASRVWPETLLLGDMVRAIRTFRPNVIVSRWNGTASDGHGHHQFSGYLTPLAIEAAADPYRFPDQLAEGLSPWQVQKYYTGQRLSVNSLDEPALLVDTGKYDTNTGRSFFQIGMQGRSQQKTQQMGSLEFQGQQISRLKLTMSRFDNPNTETSVLTGLETSINSIASIETAASEQLVRELNDLQEIAARSLDQYTPVEPSALIPLLADGLRVARAARELATEPDTRRLLTEKEKEFENAILLAAGITVDALSELETLVPGTSTTVAIKAFIPDGMSATLSNPRLIIPAEWSYVDSSYSILANELDNRRREQAELEYLFDVSIPSTAKLTQPYWLETPREGAAYNWNNNPAEMTQPFGQAVMIAEATISIDGLEIKVQKEVEHRLLDRVRGEIRRRVDVVPAISVQPGSDLLVIPSSTDKKQHELVLTLVNHSQQTQNGEALFSVPTGWTLEPALQEFSLPPSPATTTLSFSLTLPDDVAAGEYNLTASATINGLSFQQSLNEIAYPHIRTHRLYEPSQTQFQIVDVEVADVRVGYVMGSGDRVPEALRRLGLDVQLLTDEQLTIGNLSEFDVIVIGIRASQTREAYVANNQRLHAFAEDGGMLIVQYQQPDFASKNLAPFPASMEGNVRVVDENAQITILEPEHPVFNYPNQINQSDFENWVQERNNYNFTSFDRTQYIPLTEAHDEGEPESDGAMLYAKLGDGHYVYTAYSWFRQLPNGVPGAYRLFANLLSLSASQ